MTLRDFGSPVTISRYLSRGTGRLFPSRSMRSAVPSRGRSSRRRPARRLRRRRRRVAEAVKETVLVVNGHFGEMRHRPDRSCPRSVARDVPQQPRGRGQRCRVARASVVDELAAQAEAPWAPQDLVVGQANVDEISRPAVPDRDEERGKSPRRGRGLARTSAPARRPEGRDRPGRRRTGCFRPVESRALAHGRASRRAFPLRGARVRLRSPPGW